MTNQNLTENNWGNQLTTFALAYGYFNRAFYTPPADEFIQTWVDERLFAEWPLAAENEQTKMGLQLLEAFSANWGPAQLAELKQDYARLFVGPDRLLAPPWESVYLSTDHLVFEQQTVAVRHFYGRFNLQAPNLNTEPDDHIGLELAFMAHLCTLCLFAIDENDEAKLNEILQAQRDFLSEHLLLWTPQFCGWVIERSKTEYFRGIGHLLSGCLQSAAEMLGISQVR